MGICGRIFIKRYCLVRKAENHNGTGGKDMKVEKIPALIGLVLIILLAFLIIWQAGI